MKVIVDLSKIVSSNYLDKQRYVSHFSKTQSNMFLVAISTPSPWDSSVKELLRNWKIFSDMKVICYRFRTEVML